MVAFRDLSPVTVARRGKLGRSVAHVTGCEQLPFGRDENQAKTYDD
jgi:hypothetical protein